MMKMIAFLLGLFPALAFADPITAAIGAVTSVLGTTGTAVATGLLGSAVGKKMFGGKSPKVKAPEVMPTMNDDQVKDARRRQIAAMQARSGRASTILSDGDKTAKLGG